MTQKRHVMHGRDHCPDGADPIPCLPNAGGATTYTDLVMAHPALVHYWPGDEPSGNLIDRVGAWDLVRSTHSYSSETWPQYGAPGPLLEFPEQTSVENDGLQGALNDHNGAFSYTYTTDALWAGTFTIEAWVYATDTSSVHYLVDVGPVGAGNHTGLYLVGGDMYFGYGGTSVGDPDAFPTSSWQHVVGRFTGTAIDLFRNGALVATAASGNNTITQALAWLNAVAGENPFVGRSAHLAVYDDALTDDEILSHVAAQTATGNQPDGYVLTSDGEGGFVWEPVPVTPRRLLAQLQGPMPGSPESSGMYRIPFWAGASIEYTLSRASLHLENVGSTSTVLVIEKSSTADVFTPETVATLTVAASSYLDEETSGLGTLESGNLIRWTWTAVGTGADNFHATLEGEEA